MYMHMLLIYSFTKLSIMSFDGSIPCM